VVLAEMAKGQEQRRDRRRDRAHQAGGREAHQDRSPLILRSNGAGLDGKRLVPSRGGRAHAVWLGLRQRARE
jgi:hypothetical protein